MVCQSIIKEPLRSRAQNTNSWTTSESQYQNAQASDFRPHCRWLSQLDLRTQLRPWHLTRNAYSSAFISCFLSPSLHPLPSQGPGPLKVESGRAHLDIPFPFLPCAPRVWAVSLAKGLLSISLIGLIHKENSYWHNCSSGQESQGRSLLPWCGVQLFSSAQQAPLGQLPTILHSLRSPTPHWLCLKPRKGRVISKELWLSEYGHLKSKGS